MLSRIQFFPIGLFGAIMGWSGLVISYQMAHELLMLPALVYQVMLFITLGLFTLFTLTYTAKLFLKFQAVKNEFNHPIALNFFPTISISLLLISVMLKDLFPEIGEPIWFIGAAMQLVFTIVIINRWIHHDTWEIVHATPAWFIPVVGNVVAPLGAVAYGYTELGWFFFSIGITFWLVLKAIVMYRLIFHPFLQPVLIPTLFIFIAPPAVGFLSYVELNNYQLDNFAHVLYYAALFITLLLFAQGKRFINVPFAVSWWAYSFPIAAITSASFLMYELTANKSFGYIASFFIAFLTALIVHLTLRTLIGAFNKEICQPPKH
ncbi:SLAC1 anion channel family protein [Thiomicrospira microaerophila]|uniref:SLAC1 anion channel family protein n=1 Tax=Thiomicrospira microaerophila TaxID=406020 RepID=UPI0005CB6638|nr:SLAC1 anion channel family protein [Thiomicrospira microaerophila]